MKKILGILLVAAAVCVGCTSRYDITLNNGNVITAKGKPKFDQDKNGFYYTDAYDKPNFISALRVTQVAPHSMRQDDSSQFKPLQGK
jgi:hypothetical protein